MSIVAGCVAGILGLTNLAGFATYLVFAALAPLIFQLHMGFDSKQYFEHW